MNILVTAGNTQTPIDQVRCITNIFSGRTGTRIAVEAARRGHAVTLLTSRPEIVAEPADAELPADRWFVKPYRTFDDLAASMETTIRGGSFDAIIHAAAVSDYALAGVFTRAADGTITDASAGKIASSHPELWLKLTPAPKLVDRIRSPWGFAGTLVKFKLEVGLNRDELWDVAETARVRSAADWIVANTLEGMNAWALVGPVNGGCVEIEREVLPSFVIDLIERHSGRVRV